LDTVEVGESFDAGLTTAYDEQAKQMGPEVAGVLPEGFPRDVPLYIPSSLIDFGEGDGGRSYLEFDTSDSQAVVRRRLEADLSSSGWRPRGSGPDASFAKGDRQIGLTLSDLRPGTRIRYVYRPEP
jgi:hypothetical protein